MDFLTEKYVFFFRLVIFLLSLILLKSVQTINDNKKINIKSTTPNDSSKDDDESWYRWLKRKFKQTAIGGFIVTSFTIVIMELFFGYPFDWDDDLSEKGNQKSILPDKEHRELNRRRYYRHIHLPGLQILNWFLYNFGFYEDESDYRAEKSSLEKLEEEDEVTGEIISQEDLINKILMEDAIELTNDTNLNTPPETNEENEDE